MSALVFMDTETTGLALDDDIWEIAAIRRDEDGTETELHLFVEHDPWKCGRLPEAFRIDHAARFPSPCSGRVVSPKGAASRLSELFGHDRPHVVGAVPNFDTERLRLMIQREWPHWPRQELWHYHLIDVESLAVGWLHGIAQRMTDEALMRGDTSPVLHRQKIAPPWNSDDLSRACGVEPPTTERHTAMGDVRWAMTLYDVITGAAS